VGPISRGDSIATQDLLQTCNPVPRIGAVSALSSQWRWSHQYRPRSAGLDTNTVTHPMNAESVGKFQPRVALWQPWASTRTAN